MYTPDLDTATLVSLRKAGQLPGFVGETDGETLVKQAAAGPFADPVNRAFSAGSKAATWLTVAALALGAGRAAALSPQKRASYRAALKDSIDYWELNSEVAAVDAYADKLRKEAGALPITDEGWAFVWNDSAGKPHRSGPMRNDIEVGQAAAWLEKNAADMTFDEARGSASRILKKANQLGVALVNPDFITRQAGAGVVSASSLAAHLVHRSHLVKDAAARLGLLKLAKAVLGTPAVVAKPDFLRKTAAAVDEVDRDNGLRQLKGLPTPAEIVTELPFHKLAELRRDICETQAGTVYTMENLSAADPAKLAGAFGDGFVEEVKLSNGGLDIQKLATIVATLPRREAELFDQVMGQHYTKKAASRHRLGREDYAMLAEMHGKI